MVKKGIELNAEFKKAWELAENTAKNVFITGKAGSGKSTFLEYFRQSTRKKVVVLAPTGVAALNVKGETIHSFFRFKPDITVEKVKEFKGKRKNIYKKIDTIVIDEISMVRADLLDCIDKSLRLNGRNSSLPFGGIQMIFIGDLYQLPPVVTSKEKVIFKNYYKSPYFFDAKVFVNFSMEFIEFEKIYRQRDERFIGLLNKIRNNSINDEELGFINKRVAAAFSNDKSLAYTICLTTTNKKASYINEEYLSKLNTKAYTYEAEVKGKFGEKIFPADYTLKVKVGSQVMLLNNDSAGRWVNGTMAKIGDIKNKSEKGKDAIVVRLSNGRAEEILPYKWEIFHFHFNEDTDSLETEVLGYFVQYPLKLAWAITIHKSQGKTFDRVIIDLERGTFASGQMYVALSRCISLEGIVLKQPLKKKHILMDWRIVRFLTRYQYNLSEKQLPLKDKIQSIQQAIKEREVLEIVYLKPNDEKTRRIVKPLNIGQKMYLDKQFIGMEAFCFKKGNKRIFRIDRILRIAPAQHPKKQLKEECVLSNRE